MAVFACLFTAFVAFILPIGVAIFLSLKKKGYLKFVLMGVLCFVVSQVIIRMPIIAVIEKNTLWFTVFNAINPIINVFILSLSAGIFEEIGRYIFMRFLIKKQPLSVNNALCFGVGHGGIEAILLVGLNYLVSLFIGFELIAASGQATAIFAAGVERLSAMGLHMALSVLVMLSVKNKKPLLLVLAVVFHTAINFFALFVQMVFGNMWAVEIGLIIAVLGVWAVVITILQTQTKGEIVQ